MKITKYEHACFTVEKDGQSIVVDPGSDTNDLEIPSNVVAILITHEHPDHFFPERIAKIRRSNPQATVYGPGTTVGQIDNAVELSTNQVLSVGNFEIKTFINLHDLVHPESPKIPNAGYLIDETIYYGGDSLGYPDNIHPTVAAIPIAASWMRLGDAIDMLRALKPQYAFPTHDRQLNDTGKKVADGHIHNFVKGYGINYKRLKSKESMEI